MKESRNNDHDHSNIGGGLAGLAAAYRLAGKIK